MSSDETSLTIERKIHFRRGARGRRRLQEGEPPPRPRPPGRTPRVSRLMALAIRFETLIASGEIKNYAELAQLGLVSRARVSQIMNLRFLAPDIQEEILFLPTFDRGRDPITEKDLRPIVGTMDWHKQRRQWTTLKRRLE